MKELHNKNTNLVKDIIIGMSDGLTVPFALTAGLSGVLNTNHLIIVSGLAEITAGCISMGLGGFLAGQSEVEHYDSELKREYQEVETVPLVELKEVEDIFTKLGVEVDLSKQVALQVSRNKNHWVDLRGSNPQPSGPHPDALPIELRPTSNQTMKNISYLRGFVKKKILHF